MPTAYIGFGSNLGNRRQNIDQALSLIESEKTALIKKVSTIIESDPVGGPPQGKFLNGAAEIETSLSPQELLQALKNIEKKMGRLKTVRNGPRVIDLDILLYNSISLSTRTLTIPHPRMFDRDFVLIPLKEIASDALNKHYANY